MKPEMRTIQIPEDLAKLLEADAARAGMPFGVYLAFLARSEHRQHDNAFRAAAERLMTRFPQSLKKLAQ